MKKIFVLPIIGLILGAVSIATEVKMTRLIPPGQILSGVVIDCIKDALDIRETAVASALMTYQEGSLTALTTRKTSLLFALDKATKSEVKSAISATWKAYKLFMTDLKTTLSNSRKSAWSTYSTTVKSCKGSSLVQNIDFSTVNNER